jgi:hypothetical protein
MDGSGVHRDVTDRFLSTVAFEKPTKFADDVFYDNKLMRYYRSFYDIPEGSALRLMTRHVRSWLAQVIAKLFITPQTRA